ncbi:MAG TPA: M48 family peptidase [Thiotrichales bacterium]|nr:M48 family peptidase [Thiotrichales bacterium]
MPLPPFRVITHPRARRILIKVDPRHGLCVTLPPGHRPPSLEALLERHREFWEPALARLEHRRRSLLDPAVCRPDQLRLPACGESYFLRYRQGSPGLRPEGDTLLLSVPADRPEAAAQLLGAFLRRRAKDFLPERVAELAESTGLYPARVVIRRQRTRWGSVSGRGTLSLNDRLLFLPTPLVRHVLLHELTHLRQPNHSPAFWALLRRLDPSCDEHRRALRHTDHLLPPWLELT